MRFQQTVFYVLLVLMSFCSVAENQRVWMDPSADSRDIYFALFGELNYKTRSIKVMMGGGQNGTNKVQSAGDRHTVILPVEFTFDSRKVTTESEQFLEQLANAVQEKRKKLLRAGSKERVILSIDSHTDAVGPDEYNRILSEIRAETVRDVLVNLGIESSEVEVQGYGEERLLVASRSNSRNRRVEVSARVVAAGE
jgi:outer membrane protein OmpA-like peptidoglycan-associated protein